MKKSRGKFVELAEKRVNKSIKDLRLIGNLANKTNYDYRTLHKVYWTSTTHIIILNHICLNVKNVILYINPSLRTRTIN